MRIIKASTVLQYAKKHASARRSLAAWLLVAGRATWQSIDDVRKTYPHADAAMVQSQRTVTIFNIAGNNYRLIAAIHYNTQKVYIRDFLTHAQYSKQAWKEHH